MVLKFSIKSKERNVIVVTGLTQDTDQYLPEDSEIFSYYNYKYSDCVTINVLQQVTTLESNIKGLYFNTHDVLLDESIIELPKDGLYEITHVVLPSVNWLEKVLETDKDFIKEYSNIYVSDGCRIYKYSNGEYLEVDAEEIIITSTSKTTISRATSCTFSIWKLQSCFIYLCNKIFQSGIIRCKKNLDEDILMKRDIIWMTLNIIKYYLEFGQIYEAQRILEEINYCQGLCNNISNSYKNNIDCGCS